MSDEGDSDISDILSEESSDDDLELILDQPRVKNENYLEEVVPQYSEEVFFEHFRLSRATANSVSQRYEGSLYFHDQPGHYGNLSAFHQVFLNETCVVPKDCEVCDNEGHHPGDTWKKDKCTTCSCEGNSLKCETQHCAGSSTICERGFNAIQLPSNEEECCDKYACVPEPTAGPTCETPQKLLCGPNQILKLDTKPNGCQTFICECKPREECEPLDLTTDIPLEPGYVKDVEDKGCCPVLKQICKKELCPPPNECPQFHSLKTDEVESKCCPLFSCEPPKDKCIFETAYTAATKGGERLLTKFEKQQVLKGANETWNDGPCRECKCILTSIGNYQPTCSQTDCPSIKTHSDYSDYELALQPVFEQCCANIKRTGCKHNGKTYKVGEKWPIGTDHCTTMECIDSATGILKETRVKSCDKKCELGFVYEEPKPEVQECCGSCKPVACAVDGVLREIGEEWTSADHCVNYFCINVNGSLQVQAVVVNCPEVPEDVARDFVIDTLTVEGQCCKEHIPTACKVGDTIYKVGESWPSPDGDKCKTIKCVEKPDNQGIMKQESIQTCKKDCAKGSEYNESNRTCCGSCVQVACVVDGHIKKSNEKWMSEDNCTTFTCERLGDQFSVTSQLETCPAVTDCPDENLYIKGCCKFCNTSISESQTLCSPEAIPLSKTVNMIKDAAFPQHGLCVNKEPIVNFTECVGSCPSSTMFNIASGFHESVCSCCQANKYTSIIVELTCSDGAKKKKKVAVPSQCGCEGCAANKSSFKKSPTKTGVKTTK